ncbi:hypothetical protein [Parabacteroides pacaensis]|uniref:hypothetical protein n=1 Tax=Parabacteroides pacaensis TaxID=2086575 RepID=UPI000D10CFB8|nr:hypothetical protein [Parabacteroides pacaensis]
MKNKSFCSLCLVISYACFGELQAQTVVPVIGKDIPVIKNYTTSWIGNDGGWEETHIPHDMLNLYVRPDGVVATICGWDEGGTNVGVFKDGRLISRPEGSGTGGWGRFSGKAVVLDDKYVYQLLTQHGCDGGNTQLNQNKLPQFPPCNDEIEWKTVRRYDYKTGLAAPFTSGYGYKGDMLIVCSEKKRNLAGLAISQDEIFVAVTGWPEQEMPDSIKVYNKEDMSYLRGYPVKGGVGLIYADNKDGLWMQQGQRILRIHQQNGKLLPQSVTLPEKVKNLSFVIDTYQDRLLVPNRGKDLNLLIYTHIYDQPILSGTFGTLGGVMSRDKNYLPGQAGPLRFSGPCAVGVDKHGNIYIANTFVGGGRGAVLEAYNEKEQTFLWKSEGLIFTATADFDRSVPGYFYSPEKVHQADLNRNGCRLDKLEAYTVDPFLFPEDERGKENGPFITSCFKRTIQGKSCLFVSDMYGGMLAGYRFDKQKNGYIGIPFMYAGNGDPDKNRPLTFWTDKNGDGKRQPDEFADIKEVNQYSMSFFVDQQGNIWRGVRGNGFMLWKVKKPDERGIPQYEPAVRYSLPEGFSDAKRIYYDTQKDELFLGGFSPAFPDSQDTWWAMGSTIAVCRNFMQRAASGEFRQANWKPDLLLYIPFHIEDGSGKDYSNAKAFAVEGEYIFVALAREGYITVYDRSTGKFIGRLEPTEEVNKQSGWCDFNYAINVKKEKDGSYYVLMEENGFGKILCYHIVEM